MATQSERNAQGVIENVIDIQLAARRLRMHSTVRSNKRLAADVDTIERAAQGAAMLTCILWFKRDTLSDLGEPPAQAA